MSERSALIRAFTAMMIFGSVPALVGFVSANSYTIGIMRLIQASIITSILFVRREKLKQLTRKDWRILITIGLCFGFHWLFYFWAIKGGSASIAALGETTYGIQLVFLGWFFRLNTINRMDMLAVLLACFGALLAIPELSLESNLTFGLIYGVISGTFFACLPILHQRHSSIDGDLRIWAQFTFALPVFLVFLPWTDWELRAIDWVALIYLGAIVTAVGHSLWVQSSTVLSTTKTSVISYLYLPFAIFAGWYILSEEITWHMLVGASCIIGANALSLWSRTSANAQ